MSETHIAFSENALANIVFMHAKLAPRAAKYLVFPERLNVGPIEANYRERRDPWLIGHTLSGDVRQFPSVQEIEMFWNSLESSEDSVIVWWSQRATSEFAGFLALVSEMKDPSRVRMIDLTESEDGTTRFEQMRKLISASACGPELLQRFDGTEVAITPAEIATYRARWAKLRTEDAPIRVLDNGTLKSADADYFDNALVSFAKPDWQMAAMLMAQMFIRDSERSVFESDEMYVGWRIWALSVRGLLERRGNVPAIREFEVRLTA